MMIYQVTLEMGWVPSNNIEEVEADYYNTQGGNLNFKKQNDESPIATFAAGQWRFVKVKPEKETASRS